MERHAGQDASPALEDKVAFLRLPGSYPDPTRRVTAVETHMSWVFLADSLAYKLKKPVCYDFLDFSTVEARRQDCEAELRLNRRLAADVYLAVVPLRQAADGHLGLRGKGRVVDWLVKMRRLPAERMLDNLIRQRKVSQDAICSLARKFAAFYASAVPEPIDAASYRQRLADQIDESLRELSRPEFGLPVERVVGLADAQRVFLHEQAALLDARVAQRRIVEGHGDVRPEHVCLLPEPVVIDCLEFKRDFRIIDPLDELGGYLALECERLGMPEVGTWLLTSYGIAGDDHWPAPLLHFYQSCRAALRARLAIWHLRDEGCPDPQKWMDVANEYLDLAERHIERAQC
jgi:aminoglycoside phosphotransferase family enzyme